MFMENVSNRLKTAFIKKDDHDKMLKLQSNLTFNGIHISNDNYDSYTFKPNEILKDKPLLIGFAILK